MNDDPPAGASPAIVDAHLHLWDTAAFELPWLASVPELSERYTVSDYLAAVGEAPVGAAVVVQAGDTAVEARWLFDVLSGADAHRLEAAAVVQFAAERDAWLGRVQSAVDERGVLPRGVRLPVHRRGAEWTALEGLPALLGAAEQRGLVVEVLCRPDQVAAVDGLAARHPGLVFVLDHLGIGTSDPDSAWRSALRTLSARANVVAKVSGLFAAGDDVVAGAERARSVVQSALQALGPERIMFGSDWPMSSRIGPYVAVLERTHAALGSMTARDAEAVWSSTARATYSLHQYR
ncbi:hypothetical protein ASE14_15700 [Agromyces sp. Root81]|uniref:amidohydrolase family protein n=1 Tax=Agromyces sp. Root81 TaxID=1736601 RepID=UPI0006FFCA91|nr:amidohydrolase family protein [Agromyces sp. Root81]KRC59211.1 hypothetical protein ASE14_15700 [Agromyces sp. Root81]